MESKPELIHINKCINSRDSDGIFYLSFVESGLSMLSCLCMSEVLEETVSQVIKTVRTMYFASMPKIQIITVSSAKTVTIDPWLSFKLSHQIENKGEITGIILIFIADGSH